MNVIEASVPAACFPRYQYMLKIRKDLAKRYNCLNKNKILEDCEPLLDFIDENIRIFMCKSEESTDQFIDIKSIIPRNWDTVNQKEYKIESLKKDSKFFKNAYCIFFKDMLTKLEKFSERTIFIGTDINLTKVISNMLGSQKHTVVCLVEDVGAALSTQLERHALAGMRVASDKLFVILTGNTTEGISNTGEPPVKSENVESTKQRSKSAGSSVKDSPRQAYRHLSVTTEQIPCVKGKQGKIKSPKSGTPVDISDTDSDLIERLYYEFVGLFNRSILPEDENPSHSECLYNIDKTILQELQELSNAITSCGYRYSTLQVNVNVKTISNDLKHSIGHIMEKHNITKYSVVPSVIKEYSTCTVGQGVRVEYVKNEFYTGTLGGFAYTSSGESKRDWAILSRHFAKSSFDRKLYIAKQENMYIGEIMKEVKDDETNKEYLDVAAASLDDNISSDKTYVTEKNESVQGKLFSYDAKKLMCLPVHIKGAKTELGLGTISVPEQIAVQNDNLDENYIIVEDREEGNAFCQKGDSGAIVCAENPDKYGEEVHLIAMVMGENMSKKGSYTTVRLDKGLEQLKSLTNKDFNMY